MAESKIPGIYYCPICESGEWEYEGMQMICSNCGHTEQRSADVFGTNQMKYLGDKVKEQLPKDKLFALFIFPAGKAGAMNYISNGNREQMLNALKEIIEKWESGEGNIGLINDN